MRGSVPGGRQSEREVVAVRARRSSRRGARRRPAPRARAVAEPAGTPRGLVAQADVGRSPPPTGRTPCPTAGPRPSNSPSAGMGERVARARPTGRPTRRAWRPRHRRSTAAADARFEQSVALAQHAIERRPADRRCAVHGHEQVVEVATPLAGPTLHHPRSSGAEHD